MQEDECIVCWEKYKSKFLSINYPLRPLSFYYQCQCKTLAHNICIYEFIKCPTCNKEFIPITIVITKYDEMIDFILNILQINHFYFIKLLKLTSLFCIFTMFIMIYEDLTYKSIINMNYIIIRLSTCMFSSFILFTHDYINKYWIF